MTVKILQINIVCVLKHTLGMVSDGIRWKVPEKVTVHTRQWRLVSRSNV